MRDDVTHDGALRHSHQHALVVVDWTIDPHRVVATCCERAAEGPMAFTIVAPAWLHGLDWIGDPMASYPCARRQLQALVALADTAGLDVVAAEVGDPDPLAAIVDALGRRPADEVVLMLGGSKLFAWSPFAPARRARRLTGLSVRLVPVSAMDGGERSRGSRRRAGHCDERRVRSGTEPRGRSRSCRDMPE
jgi:hypothetical protein